MINDKTFKWDYYAARKLLLKSDEIAKFCEEQAERMTRATGMDYKFETERTSQRVIVEREDDDAAHGGDNTDGKFKRDPETGWPICPKCGVAHYHCTCYRKKG